MRFFNAHRRPIGLIALFSFLILLQVTATPAAAQPLPSPDDRTMAPSRTDEGSGTIEQQAPSYYKPKKSSPIIPIIIGVVVLGAVGAVLYFVVFKTKYNIVGSWTVWDSLYNGTYNLTFAGDKKSGTVSSTDFSDTGTYSVSGKDVNFRYSAGGDPWVHTGKFESKDRMTGTITFQNESGTWYADRDVVANPSASSPRVEKKNKIKTK